MLHFGPHAYAWRHPRDRRAELTIPLRALVYSDTGRPVRLTDRYTSELFSSGGASVDVSSGGTVLVNWLVVGIVTSTGLPLNATGGAPIEVHVTPVPGQIGPMVEMFPSGFPQILYSTGQPIPIPQWSALTYLYASGGEVVHLWDFSLLEVTDLTPGLTGEIQYLVATKPPLNIVALSTREVARMSGDQPIAMSRLARLFATQGDVIIPSVGSEAIEIHG